MKQNLVPPIKIYTDGCSLGNPGPGGWAAVLIHGNKRKELSGGYHLTTNNRMEILAAVMALRALKKPELKAIIHSDSQLLVNAVKKNWISNWAKKNWIKSDRTKVLNVDLWKQLSELLKVRDVEFVWVKGHAGIEENERCDILSKEAAGGYGLPTDEGYINEHKPLQDALIDDTNNDAIHQKRKSGSDELNQIKSSFNITREEDDFIVRDSNNRKKFSLHYSEIDDFINKLKNLL